MKGRPPNRFAWSPKVAGVAVGIAAGLVIRLALWALLHWPMLAGRQAGRGLLLQLSFLGAGAWAGEWLGARLAEDILPVELHGILSGAFAALGAVASLLVQAMVLDANL